MGSANKSRQSDIDVAFSLIFPFHKSADEKIVDAVKSTYDWIRKNPECSLSSKKCSLKVEVRNRVDPVFLAYAKSIDLPIMQISECLSEGHEYFEQTIKKWSAGKRASMSPIDEKYVNICKTTDVLIDLSMICSSLSGVDTLAIQMENTKTNTVVNKVRAKKSQRALTSEMPRELQFFDEENICELCSNFTERASAILQVKNLRGDPAAINLINEDGSCRISTPGCSPRFCHEHSPKSNPTRYQTAQEKKTAYSAMRYLLIACRKILRHHPGNVILMRSLSFAVVDELKFKGKKLREAIPDVVDRYHSMSDDNEDTEREKLIEFFQEIIGFIRSQNSQLYDILCMLYSNEDDQHDDAYKSAVNNGIIPKIVDDNLDFAFQRLVTIAHEKAGLKPSNPLKNK